MGEAKAKKEDAKKENAKKIAVKNKKETNKDTKNEVAKQATKKAPTIKKDSKTSTGTSLKKFFKGAVSELKKVHWPGKQQIIAFTTVVVVSVLVVAAAIWVVDAGLTQLVKLVLKK